MTSTWHVRFRLAVQFPKKSSHLERAGSKAEGLGSVPRQAGSGACMARQWPGRTGALCLGSGEVAYQVKGSLRAQS